ncbi:MAG: FtsX-like permease family protein [Bacilli bacterium]|nr:FtsX-like permease family protein [Bacilli bacterium]
MWKQFLAIIAIGAIAVTLFVGLQANADSLASRVNSTYEAGNLADSYVTVNPIKGQQGDEAKIREIVGEKGDVSSRFYGYAKVNTYNCYCAISPTLPTISRPSNILSSNEEEDFLYIDSILSRDPSVPSETRMAVGDIATVEFDLTAYMDEIGNTAGSISAMSLFLKSGVKLEDTPLSTGIIDLKIPVTGVMDHPENVLRASYSVSLFLLSSSAFKTAFKNCLKQYFNNIGVSLILAKIAASPLGWKDNDDPSMFPISNQFLIKGNKGSDIDAINESIDAYFKSKSEEDKNLLLLQKKEETSFATVMETDVTQARQLTFVFPFVFFIVAILVILTTMSQLILKDRINIGTLKAMGVGKRKIQVYYGVITTTVVGLGILIGEILGPIIIPMILDNKYHILYNLPKLSYLFPILPGILTAIVFLVLANVVTFITCRKETSLLPVQSMRPAVQNFAKNSSKTIKKSKKRRDFSFVMSRRNILVDPLKSIMVVLGVAGCTALLCCGFGIDDTINKGIVDDPLITSNAEFTLTCAANIETNKFISDLKSVIGDELNGVEGTSKTDSTIRLGSKEMSSSLLIYSPVIRNGESNEETFLEFSWNLDEVLLTKKVADRIGAKVGDTISFVRKGATIEAKVGVIRDIFFSNGVYVHASSPILKDDVPTSYSSFLADLKEGSDVSRAKKELKEKISYLVSVNGADDYKAQLQDILSSVSAMTQAIKIFAILLAIVVLYNISLLNFRQRSRDIATMKVLGFTRIEMAGPLLLETMSLTLFGVILGLAAGWPFLYLVLYINQVEVVSYPYFVAPLSYFLSFLLTFVVAVLINIYLANRTKKVLMVESLKSVE